MKLDIKDITGLFTPVGRFFRRFHSIIFFLFVSIGLFTAILVLLSIINHSANTSLVGGETINGSFDEATIKRVEDLGTRSPSKPGSRPSPFVEP